MSMKTIQVILPLAQKIPKCILRLYGQSGVMDDGDLEGRRTRALYAADRAQKRSGSSDDAVLDALEAAEAAYAAQHQPGGAAGLLCMRFPVARKSMWGR